MLFLVTSFTVAASCTDVYFLSLLRSLKPCFYLSGSWSTVSTLHPAEYVLVPVAIEV